EVVSRVHANIRVEEDRYYIEDVGSANGTYINHNVLAKGNRHALRAGDRIGLGKGDFSHIYLSSYRMSQRSP
ncbi:MAG: FHA domain-containing protein, partial [Chamaesiphon sp. CSU_1_12]|nr:FHA domain-containing protein [Chamaesiphon sp. CSU_1_12]